MHSASPQLAKLVVVAALCSVAGGALAACNTTQQTAARLKVRSNRLLIERRPLEVTRAASEVKVVGAALVRGGGGDAIAVDLRNVGRHPVNDLPLAVGLRRNGRIVYLNHKPSSYFQGHAPALAPGEQGTWVFTTKDKVRTSGAVVARIGVAPKPPVTTASEVPTLEVERVATAGGKRGSTVKALIHNPTGLPQYDVAVYAWARRGGRFLAAGQASLDEVGVDASEEVSVKLIGDPGGAPVRVFAPATIFE